MPPIGPPSGPPAGADGERGGEAFVEGEEVLHPGAVAGERVAAVALIHGLIQRGVGGSQGGRLATPCRSRRKEAWLSLNTKPPYVGSYRGLKEPGQA